jgi:polyisoprenoid-binding protein YceI
VEHGYLVKYPNLTFKSKRAEKLGSERYKVTGDLTLRGVTNGARGARAPHRYEQVVGFHQSGRSVVTEVSAAL